MKHVACATVVVMLFLVCVGSASAFVADGDLTDWGVTPFVDWTPDPGVTYNPALDDDDLLKVVTPPNVLQNETFDYEALYAVVDPSELRLALVTSFNWQDLGWAGQFQQYSGWNANEADRFLTIPFAFPGAGSAAPPGSATGWNYAIRLWGNKAELYSVPEGGGVWWPLINGANPRTGVPDPNGVWEGAQWFEEADPVGFRDGYGAALLDTVDTGNNYFKYYNALGEPLPRIGNGTADTWIYEVSFDLTGTGLGTALEAGGQWWAHTAPWCGNDDLLIGDELVGIPEVPEPASLVLLGLCAAGLGARLRRRRRSG